MNPLSLLCVADSADSWAQCGFTVDDDRIAIGGVTIRLGGQESGDGFTGWAFDGRPGGGTIDGIAVVDPPAADPLAVSHPNGIVAIDHLVVMTGDVDRTVAALAVVGSEPRRRREVDFGDTPSVQVFCWSGDLILEVVGPASPTEAAASLWGLTLVADDIDATVAFLGDLASPARTAVQPGRRIASIDRRAMGSSVRLAVMDRHISVHKDVTDEWRSQ